MKLIGKSEVAGRLKCHPEHVMRMAREGKFPKPIKLSNSSNSAVRFIETEVDAWLAERMAARQGEPV